MKNSTFRSATPASEARIDGRDERMLGRDGEINAGSKRELMQTISSIMTETASGRIVRNQTAQMREERAKEFKHVAEAYKDHNTNTWATLGSDLANSLNESADREGFMRRFLERQEVAQGSLPRIKIIKKGVTAVVASSAAMVRPQFVRDQYLMPPEFTISANVRVELREINQGSGDIMEEKFLEGQEQIMVAEDRTFKMELDQTINDVNAFQTLVGGLTPANLSYMRDQVTRWNLPAFAMLFASDYWNDIVANPQFSNWYDPVSKYELVSTGYLGNLLGFEMVTDAYRNEKLKVLNMGELYILSRPNNLGGYTDRGPVQSIDVNSYEEGSPARGWYMFEAMSMVVFNPRAVIKGQRA